MLVRIVYVLTEFPVCLSLVSSLRLWDVSDAKKHLQVIKAKDKQGTYVHTVLASFTACVYLVGALHCYVWWYIRQCTDFGIEDNLKQVPLICICSLYGTSSIAPASLIWPYPLKWEGRVCGLCSLSESQQSQSDCSVVYCGTYSHVPSMTFGS